MDRTAALNGVMASLSHLRRNAELALATGGAQTVSETDLARLDAIASGAFGVPLDRLEFATIGSAPKPDGPIMTALLERLPGDKARESHAFLVDLHTRVHRWFSQVFSPCDSQG